MRILTNTGLSKALQLVKSWAEGAFATKSHAHTWLGTSSYYEVQVDTQKNSVKMVGGTATGVRSVAEGAVASGMGSHAEGSPETEAGGIYAHAEGSGTEASGTVAHSEGVATVASGAYSHAEGFYAVAAGRSQHAQGEYNVRDDMGAYAHIVGGGTGDDARANIHTLDWDGNVFFGKTDANGDVVAYGTVNGVDVTQLRSYGNATASAAGLMSATDKSKLDALASWKDALVAADTTRY